MLTLSRVKKIFWLLSSFAVLYGCDTYKQDSYVEQYVVETFLTANEPFSPIKLSVTVPFNEEYIFENVAVSDANVVVRLQAEDGSIESEIQYVESENPGIYVAENPEETVLSGRRYHLEITDLKQDNDRITATTFVPGAFEEVAINTDSLTYQGPVQYEVTFTQGFYPGRQNVYVATSLALEPENYDLTPFWAGQDPDDEDEFLRVSSGLINEGNYELNDDGTLTLKYPWIGIAFYGPNELSIYAVDNNIFDYIRTVEIQTGGSTLSPGQIENVIWNVEGGIGIFGSRFGINRVVFIKE